MSYFDGERAREFLAAIEAHRDASYPEGVGTARSADLALYRAAGLIEAAEDPEAKRAEGERLNAEAKARRRSLRDPTLTRPGPA